MIDDAEARTWAQRLGVDVTQIRRDHMVSHLLANLPRIDELGGAQFIGGTALCRTHLDGLRVSEDIDLLVPNAVQCAESLVRQLPRLVRRHYPDITMSVPAPARVDGRCGSSRRAHPQSRSNSSDHKQKTVR